MIVKNQKVKVKWNGVNIKHYESLGYVFTKTGEEFEVDIKHLTKGSKTIVLASCDWCDKEFTREMHLLNRNGHNHHYCSNECQHKHRTDIAKNNKPIKVCEECGNKYKVDKYYFEISRFCSAKCMSKWQSKEFKGENSPVYVERFIINCDWCNTELERTEYKLNSQEHHFCNTECRQNWHREIFVKSDKFIEKSRQVMLNNLREGKIRTTKTEPHLKIINVLNKLNIKHENEKPISDYSFDIYLSDYDLYIEVNGSYWHCDNRLYKEINYTQQLDRIIKDKRKRTYLLNNYKKRVLYLWEYDIDNQLEVCINLIIEYIKHDGKLKNYHSMNYYMKDDKLETNQNILTPYMDISLDDISSIVDLEVREKVTRYDKTKHVIFECEYCGNEKTQPITTYIRSKNHFCSVKCKNLSQQIGNETDQLKFIHKCANCECNVELPNHKHLKVISGEQKNVFCSYECRSKWESINKIGENNPLYYRIKKICEHCDKEYEVTKYQEDRTHYCSIECRQKGQRNRIVVKCLNCDKDVEKTPTDIKKNKSGEYFCSHDCSNEYKRNSNIDIRECEYEHCQNEFSVKRTSKQRFCSVSCRNKGVALLNKQMV